MNEFIAMVAIQLGLKEETARQATGGLLGFIRRRLGETEFSALATRLPGSAELASHASPVASGGFNGLLGGMAARMTSSIGGGSTAGLVTQLQEAGLDLSQSGSLVGQFVEFARDRMGPELTDGLLESVPELKKLVS